MTTTNTNTANPTIDPALLGGIDYTAMVAAAIISAEIDGVVPAEVEAGLIVAFGEDAVALGYDRVVADRHAAEQRTAEAVAKALAESKARGKGTREDPARPTYHRIAGAMHDAAVAEYAAIVAEGNANPNATDGAWPADLHTWWGSCYHRKGARAGELKYTLTSRVGKLRGAALALVVRIDCNSPKRASKSA